MNARTIPVTSDSLLLATEIQKKVPGFHTYHHILLDIAGLFSDKKINYVEIGCYAGASACLMVQRKNTNVYAIDRGKPVAKRVAVKNVAAYNKHKNRFFYIEENSNSRMALYKLKQQLQGKTIDILFIDGSHKFEDVIADFRIYSKLVAPGGFIVFDDYDDQRYSPQVKKAVDFLSETDFSGYYIFERTKNEFIIRKK